MKFEAKFDVVKQNNTTRDFNRMKRKIKQQYNIKSHNDSKDKAMPKLAPPKKEEEKIIGFEDFARNDGTDDFSNFPTSFGDDWNDSPAKK